MDTLRTLLRWLRLLGCFLVLGAARAINAQPTAATRLVGYDVRLYEGGPAWELAQAVQQQRSAHIHALLKASPALAHYQEPRFGQSLLFFAVSAQLYRAAKALLEAGADPNLRNNSVEGDTPLLEAASLEGTSAFVRLLLAHGADPNLAATCLDKWHAGKTPLMVAAGNRLETVQLLLAGGADLNYRSEVGYQSALHSAFQGRQLAIIQYLLVEKGADFKQVFTVTLKGDTLRVAEWLKYLVYPLDSKNYHQKMALVRYLEARGIDYRNALPPPNYLKLYSKEFLEKY